MHRTVWHLTAEREEKGIDLLFADKRAKNAPQKFHERHAETASICQIAVQ